MLLLSLSSLNVFCQKNSFPESSTLIIDPHYKGSIKIFNNPGGKLIASLKHNFKDEDFLVIKVSNENDSMFYGTVIYEISSDSAKGWVKKGNMIGIYLRNYGNQRLNLYKSPNKQSSVQSTIKNYYSDLFKVVSSNHRWLKVEAVINKEKYFGWLEPEMQCDNPYTTCN